MKNSPSKIALTVGFLLALSFTFSCTGGGSGDDGGSSSSGGGASKNNCTDAASCKKKKIGNRTWMLENLNIDVGEGSTCYEGKSANCDKYGRLYTWAAAMDIDSKYNEQLWGESDVRHKGICPTGWHIPSNDDWDDLVNYVEDENGCDDCAAKYLKSKSGWNSGGNGNDKYEFSALPGGYGGFGYFYGVGNVGGWWSATEYSSDIASYRTMGYSRENILWVSSSKYGLFSVRCVQD